MSTIALDFIAAEVALLERTVVAPVEPYGYGRDLSCVSDLTPNLDEVSETSPRAIVEAVIRRYSTSRGELPDDADYGYNLMAFCNRGTTAREIRELEGALQNEAAKDDRIDDILVEVTVTSSARLDIKLTITPVDSSESFTATLAATSSAIILEAIQ